MTKPIESGSIRLSEIKSVQTILKVLRRITGLRAVMIIEADEKNARVRAVLDESGFGLKGGEVIDSSTTYCQTVWKTGKPFEIYHASQNELFLDHPGLTVNGVESYVGVPIFRKSGEIFGNLCAFDTIPAQFSARNIEIFEIFSELVTHELEHEIERHRLKKELQTEQEISETRTRLMSILGHDLRNPLSTILMAAKIQLKNSNADELTLDLAQKIVRSGERMQKLITDILDTAKREQQFALPNRRQAMDLCELLAQITDEFRLSHPDHTISYSDDGDCQGEWDTVRVVQVYSNLLSNALAHSAEDSPVIVSLKGEKDFVSVSVWNRGKVISAADREKIFEPFWQGLPDNSANNKGLGLGLYIVRQIMEIQGGRIEVESSEEKGTRFTAIFPR